MATRNPQPDLADGDAETAARVERLVAESDADPRTVSHDRVREWLMAIANGDFDAPVPEPD